MDVSLLANFLLSIYCHDLRFYSWEKLSTGGAMFPAAEKCVNLIIELNREKLRPFARISDSIVIHEGILFNSCLVPQNQKY